MRSYTQEEWDARETETQQAISRASRATKNMNWYANDPKGQKAWAISEAIDQGKVDPDVLMRFLSGDATPAESTQANSELAALKAELESVTTTLGRQMLDGMISKARGSHKWADEADVERAKALYGKVGGEEMDFDACLIMANREKAFKHLGSPETSAPDNELPRGGVDSLGNERPANSTDPRTAANDSWERISAAIASAQSAGRE